LSEQLDSPKSLSGLEQLIGLAPYVLSVIFPATEHGERQSQKADFSQVLLFLSLSSFTGKNIFHADPRRGLQSSEILAFFTHRPFHLKHLHSAGGLKGKTLSTLYSAVGYIMTRMNLVHSEPAAKSPPNTSFTSEAENSFSSSEDQAADGSFLQVPQGQGESRSELTISPTLPCPPFHQE